MPSQLDTFVYLKHMLLGVSVFKSVHSSIGARNLSCSTNHCGGRLMLYHLPAPFVDPMTGAIDHIHDAPFTSAVTQSKKQIP